MTYMPIGGKVSTSNSSTATLAGDAVFTGTGEDVSNFASVSILYKSDVAAAASGLSSFHRTIQTGMFSLLEIWGQRHFRFTD